MDKPSKICNICGVVKPAAAYPPHLDRCRDCHNKIRRERRAAAAVPLPCVQCGIEFYRTSGSQKICSPACKDLWDRIRVGIHIPANATCPECGGTFVTKRSNSTFCSPRCMDRVKNRRYSSDPDWVAQRKRYEIEYRARNAEEIRAKALARRMADIDAYRKYQREWAAAHQYNSRGSWRSRNLDKAANKQRARTRRIANLTPFDLSHEDVMAKVAYWGKRCWLCAGPFEAVDHVKPIAKSGLNILANLRPICRRCNSRKRDRWFGVSRLAELLPPS